MHLDLDGNGPIYEQLSRALKRSILQGALKPHARLPATRQLAQELGMSRNTVLTAYEMLVAERLALPMKGSGTYVAANAMSTAATRRVAASVPAQSRYAARLRDLPPITSHRLEKTVRYDLRYGEPMLDLALVTAWRRELSRAASRCDLNYPPSNGLRELRETVCEYVARRRGVFCAPADVLIVNGTQQAISLLARVLVDEDSSVVVEDPHYPYAVCALRAHGARIVSARTDSEGLSCEALPREGVSMVYVTPSHQFPSGVEMSPARRLALLRYAAEQRCWILEDDYDGEFRYEGHATSALRALDLEDRVIYMGTFSKTLFPALRLGYLICPPGLRSDLIGAKCFDDLASGAIEQAAMAAFMGNGGFERHLRKAALELRSRRGSLLSGLQQHCAEDIVVTHSSAGMHVVGWLPGWPGHRMSSLVEAAQSCGLGLHPIAPYYAGTPPCAGLLLGFASLSSAQLRVATRLLGETLAAVKTAAGLAGTARQPSGVQAQREPEVHAESPPTL
ncbi:PLP-dependent aminotransferase family protein [Roseateles saccharophilus]|uniref:GntR family transcriptional regulator n=1 Tax=Roseateles saccharophilus TaxID=304 RepID=A0A4R3VKI0_ROSSA|nr:PLP-dependent aminotransferase family protein [Roseateles saccharophilus]MDG0831257.1 PLP-dependent aminotransferase family protein [Roseateles saccharophilus]TCV04378.1 GntR family transcriptional regulator [Roseateles saccharophilus]